MQSQQPPAEFLKLNVWGVTLSAAIAALILAILSLPLHLMHARALLVGRSDGGFPAMTPHPMQAEGGLGLVWVFVALLVVLVYGGVGGAIFAAVYNAVLSRR